MAERIELAADLAEVSRLNDWLADVFARNATPDATAQSAKLCLNELVANVILYGYPDGAAGRIAVDVAPEGDALRFTLEDDGIAFDPLAAPQAAPITGLDDARIGGFGIKLFRESSHAARYMRSGGRNRLTFACG